MIEICQYKPDWPRQFEQIRAGLKDVLGPLALRVDHIGSTSVPGLGAKDVIDVQVTAASLDAEIIRRMTAAGYVFFEPFQRDHVPFGEDENPLLWRKLLFNQREGERRANIHVRVEGMPNQRYALLFRDYLRAHPNSARTVELIKREIAKRHADDIEVYYDIKDPVYDLIWDAAKDWAVVTAWKPGE